jgi:predicted AAA+ superfamily ATPase
MYKLLSKLVIYRNIGQDSILVRLADIIEQYHRGNLNKEDTIAAIYTQIHNLLDIATEYGFNDNLWHNYLSYLLATVENPFSMSCEKVGAREGTVNKFAKGDFAIFKALFDYDFTLLEDELGIDCFKVITDYRAIEKNGKCYNRSVSEKVQVLSNKISKAKDENEIFQIVTDFYNNYGVGMLGLNKAFRIGNDGDEFRLSPITNTEEVVLSDLIGYEIQKKKLVDNTRAFIEGKKANNVLLFGDSGTGKSTSVKAILNEYYPEGLRMIEIFKHQFKDLSTVISKIKNRNYKFIIYMDDLSFEEFEIEYKYLKAVIEGGLETKPDNVLIYATSNRRHLIRETWSDRSDMSKDELHRSDTMQEKLSLVARFGISINYSAPSQKEYFTIVEELAKKYNNFGLSKEDLLQKANMWELKGGGLSGRTASQFITYMLSQEHMG